jgi:predicted nucleotidyltransferase
MDRSEIEECLREVGAELAAQRLMGEIVIVGGAFMTLVLRSRDATKDVDAYLDPKTATAIRAAVAVVASRHGLAPDWLNDAVKGFFTSTPEIAPWAEYPGLRVNAVTPQYMLAMKALAGRPQDADDIRSIAEHLGITTAQDALEVVTSHVPERLLTPRVRYLLEDIFEEEGE